MDRSQILSILPLLVPVVILQYGLLAVALLDVLRRERVKLLPKWGWILIVVLVGILGPILYLVLGREE